MRESYALRQGRRAGVAASLCPTNVTHDVYFFAVRFNEIVRSRRFGFFVAIFLQMLRRQPQHGNFRLNAIHSPIKANIVHRPFRDCMKSDAISLSSCHRTFAWRFQPLYRDVQIQEFGEILHLGKL
jgi:hypothetical protein